MDPVQNAITQAIDASEAETAAADDKTKGGAGAGADDKNKGGEGGASTPPAELTTALEKDAAELSDEDKTLINDNADSLTEEQRTTLTEAGVLTGGEELDLATVVDIDAAELTDEQKEFLVENQDELTGKQIKAYKEAGVDFEADTTPVKGEGAQVKSDAKPHEVPKDDSDLYVEVENAEGEKFKITKIGDLPADFIYKDSRQPLEIYDAIDELKEKKAERAKLRTENDTIEDSNSTRERVATLWNDEVTEMQADGTLPEGKIDWQTGEYPNAKTKEQVEGLFSFMTEENIRREKAGRPYVVSLRDVTVLKAQADAKEAAKSGKNKDGKTPEELAKEAKDAAAKKKKAQVVAGAQGDNQNPEADDKPTYVKGSGKSITDITEEMINETAK